MAQSHRLAGRHLAILAQLAVGIAAWGYCGAARGGGAGGGDTPPSAAGGNGPGAAGGAGTTTTTGTGGSGGGGCTTSADCSGNPSGSICDTSTGDCVECTPTDDVCPSGQFCDQGGVCAAGCTDVSDCMAPTVCDAATHTCVGCNMDDDCGAGTICVSHTCIAGCSPMHDCQTGFTCCGSTCLDLASDPDHCNTCNTDCTKPAHAIDVCIAGMCGMGACDSGWADCNGDLMDGCEHNELADGPCTCAPGATQPCYYGAPGTESVGPCVAGTQTCLPSGIDWGTCTGQVMPVSEICANAIDEDCNGTADDVSDADGDGWTYCNGDCNDASSLVNPGAFEVVGDALDNDCDAATSDTVAPSSCSTAAKFTGVTGSDLARAMDLCQTTTANPPLATKKWGLISGTQVLADGSTPTGTALTDIQNKQSAVLVNFGTTITPRKNQTLAGLSTGMMRDANDPGWVIPISGTTLTTAITFPGAGLLATYLAAHGGNLLPGQCGGTACPTGTGANDSVALRLQVRVPTNAQGFSYDFRFFSAEYQSFQCTTFNDYYLALLSTTAPGIPADKNVSFDSLNNAVSVNNGFFQIAAAVAGGQGGVGVGVIVVKAPVLIN